MKQATQPQNKNVIYPILFGFFVMGFVDVVGIATNYVKSDFSLSDSLANLLPMMVFLWFAIFSIPTGILMGRVGRRNTVLISLVITIIAMLLPLFFYNFTFILLTFALLGIGNTILQVSLNPMIAYVVNKDKMTSVLTLGQLIKSISSFLGPILTGFAASFWGDWKWIFLVYSITSLLAALWLILTVPTKEKQMETNTTFASTFSLVKDKYILMLFFGILFVVGLDVGLNTTIPKLLMYKTGMPLSEAGLGTSLYFAARTAGSFIGAILLVKYAANRFLQYSILIAIATFILLFFIDSSWLLFIVIAIIGFMCASIFSILFSFGLQHKPERSNEISALMIVGVSGGALITPLMGIVSDGFGLMSSLGVLLICLLYLCTVSYKV